MERCDPGGRPVPKEQQSLIAELKEQWVQRFNIARRPNDFYARRPTND